MLRSKVPLHLLAPAPPTADGGGGSATADPMLDSNPDGLSGWMNDLPSLDPERAAANKEKKDAQATEKSVRTPPTDKPTDAKPAPAATGADAKVDAKPAGADGQQGALAAKAPEKSDDAKKADAAADAAKTEKSAVEEKWPRSSSDWERYKKAHAEKETKLQKEIETRQEKIATLETKLAEIEKKATEAPAVDPESKSKLERLQKENEQLSETIRRLDVTNHPKFKAYYGSMVEEQHKMLESAVDNPDKVKEIKELIALPEGKYKTERLIDAVNELDEWQRDDVRSVIRELRKIELSKSKAIDEELKRNERLNGESTADRESKVKAAKEQWEKVIAEATSKISKENPAYQSIPGNESWNRSVNERIAAAKRLLSGEGLTHAEVAKAAFDAVSLPTILSQYRDDIMEKDAQISKLEKQIASLTAANPGVDNAASGSDTGSPPPTRVKVGMTPQEASESFFKGLGSLS